MSAGLAARRPAGTVTGAMDGWYPSDFAIGVPLVYGATLMDEFTRPSDGTHYGDLLWSLQDFGQSPTVTSQIPTADTETGILRVSTGGSSVNEGAAIGYGDGADRTFYRSPPPGSCYAVKLRAVDTTQITIASGFFEAHAPVSGGTSNDFVGIRGAGGSNWLGVCRNGTTETTVDLGIPVSTSWAVLGFVRTEAGGVQFARFDRDGRNFVYREPIGAEVTTNLPNVALAIGPLSVVTLDGTAKAAEIDFVCLGGRTER